MSVLELISDISFRVTVVWVAVSQELWMAKGWRKSPWFISTRLRQRLQAILMATRTTQCCTWTSVHVIASSTFRSILRHQVCL